MQPDLPPSRRPIAPSPRTTHGTHGASLIDFGVIVGLIAVVAITGVSVAGDKVRALFGGAASTIVSGLEQGGDGTPGSGGNGDGGESHPGPVLGSFLPETGATPGATFLSSSATVGGLDEPQSGISSTGSFLLNGVSVPSGTLVSNGDVVQLSLQASDAFNTPVSASFTLAGITRTFTVTTRLAATDPTGFGDFAPVTGAARGVEIDSGAQTVSGLEAPATISITGGAYAIDGGAFVTTPGTISDGSSVVVRVMTSSDFSTPVTATLTIGTVAADFTVTTGAMDLTPDGFVDFADVDPGEVDTAYTSDTQTITGINAVAPIAIAAGPGVDPATIGYSVNGEAFTAAPGSVGAGDTVAVRLMTGSSLAAAYSIELTIGTETRLFTVLTAGADVNPDGLVNFAPVVEASLASTHTSAPQTIAGINTGAPIAVDGGLYAIDGGAFTDEPGTIHAGSSVVVRLTTGNDFSSAHVATLTIGAVSADFVVITAAPDTTPDGLVDFTGTQGGEINTPYASNAQTVLGLTAPASVSVAGGSNVEFQVLDASLAVVRDWSSAPTPVPVGGALRVRQRVATYDTVSTATITVGGVAVSHVVSTRAAVITPVGLADFAPVTGADPSADIASTVQTIYGIEIPVDTTVSISGGGQAAFRVNNGAGWSGYSAADKTAGIGAQVQVRITTPASFSTTSTATLGVGTESADFSVTTRAANTVPNASYVNFTPANGANPSTVTQSNAQTIAGIEAPAAVSISGGNTAQFRVFDENDVLVRGWSAASTTVPVGGKVLVRQTSSATYGATVTTTLTVGGVARSFAVTTRAAIVVPTGYGNFATVSGANPSAVTPSAVQEIAGLEAPASVSISGGSGQQFQVLDASNALVRAWSNAATTVPVGGKVQVRQTSSATYGATVTTTLTVGGIGRTFAVTTRAASINPTNLVNFTSQFTNVDPHQLRTSNIQGPMTGLEAPAPIRVWGGGGSDSPNPAMYRTSSNGSTWSNWTVSPGTIPVGGYVQVRMGASGDYGTTRVMGLEIGTVQVFFSTQTRNADTSAVIQPIPSVTGASRGEWITSSIIDVNGMEPDDSVRVPVTISGQGGPQYRILTNYQRGEYQPGSWMTSGGMVSTYDAIEMRLMSASTASTTRTATISFGGASATWSVTTN